MRAVLLTLVVLALTIIRGCPPSPKPVDAPNTEFSAGRAQAILKRLVGDGVAHPIGSDANIRVGNRILAELQAIGFRPSVQQAVVCSAYGVCATVQNIITRVPGKSADSAVLLASHYDSVGAGPGASDDQAGVAAMLEIARILRVDPVPRNTVILLFDDGEEAGSLGARAFTEHPLATTVRHVVNLEARGTSGRSMMFETGAHNLPWMRLYASAVPYPSTTSLAYMVYKRLPNDTDFTIFKEKGMQGFNLAYAKDVSHYHTSLDNWENTSPRSLQQQGSNGLALVRALAAADLTQKGSSDSVFFDVLGLFTVVWPEGWTPWMAILAVGLFVFLSHKRATFDETILGVLAWLIVVLGSALIAFGLSLLLPKVGALPATANWIAHPLPLLVVFTLLPVVIAGIVGEWLAERAGFWGLWNGAWMCWCVLLLPLGFMLPGAAYLLLIPVAAAAPCALSDKSAELAAPAVAGFFLLPLPLLLWDFMGFGAILGVTLVAALFVTTLTPALRERGGQVSLAAAAIVLVSAAVIFILPTFTADQPQRLSIAFSQSEKDAKWVVQGSPVPETLRQLAANPVEQISLKYPELKILQSGANSARVRVRSLNGSRYLSLAFEDESRVVKVQNVEVPPLSERALRFMHGAHVYRFLAVPPDGWEMEITWTGDQPPDVLVKERQAGLPSGGEILQSARPDNAVTSQDGDYTELTRKVSLKGK